MTARASSARCLRVRLFDVLATLGLIAVLIANTYLSLGIYVWLIAALVLG